MALFKGEGNAAGWDRREDAAPQYFYNFNGFTIPHRCSSGGSYRSPCQVLKKEPLNHGPWIEVSGPSHCRSLTLGKQNSKATGQYSWLRRTPLPLPHMPPGMQPLHSYGNGTVCTAYIWPKYTV